MALPYTQSRGLNFGVPVNGSDKPYFLGVHHYDADSLASLVTETKKIAATIQTIMDEVLSVQHNTLNSTAGRLIPALMRIREPETLANYLAMNFNSAPLSMVLSEISDVRRSVEQHVFTNRDLYDQVKGAYDTAHEAGGLSDAADRAARTFLGEFEDRGIHLPDDAQKRLHEIRTLMDAKRQKFVENTIDAAIHVFEPIGDEALVDGLPASLKTRLSHNATQRGLDAPYCITAKREDILEILKKGKSAALRKQAWDLLTRATNEAPFDNRTLAHEIVMLRHEEAQILGYKTYSDMAVAGEMTRTTEGVSTFLNGLKDTFMPHATAEYQALTVFAKDHAARNGMTIDRLNAWDVDYYSDVWEKALMKQKEAEKRIPLDEARDTVFAHIHSLYGLTFKDISDRFADAGADTNNEFQVFEASDQNGIIRGFVYMDLLARDGKRGGASQSAIRRRGVYGVTSEFSPAILALRANFNRADDGTITHQNMIILAHEMGHVSHSLVSDTPYPNLSGTAVARDFVELPSQFTEKGLDNKGKTNATDPMSAYKTMKRVSQALLDHRAYSHPDPRHLDLDVLERGLNHGLLGTDMAQPRHLFTYFYHIFGTSNYAARYYGYLMADVLAEDAYAYMMEKGDAYDPDVTATFKALMAQGGAMDYAQNYEQFRGRPVNQQAYLNSVLGVSARAYDGLQPSNGLPANLRVKKPFTYRPFG